MERWVCSVRIKCLDRLLIDGSSKLKNVLRVYLQHYNRQRPRRALDLKPPDTSIWPAVRAAANPQDLRVSRRDLLGGLIHEYDIPAAA